MVGSDICGFIDPTTEELCARWQSLGAFYPFARNHHEPEENQEPYLWASVEAVTKKTLAMRYSLLPVLYTLFAAAHTNGGTVARSLMFNFPTDPETYPIDTQFMWGSALLITPVLTQGADSVRGYFPPAQLWYNAWNMTALDTNAPGAVGGWITLPCAIEDGIVLHIAGGSILPTQYPELTTAATRLNAFTLLVAFDANQSATGSLFWDDGSNLIDGADSIDLSFSASGASGQGLGWTVERNTYTGLLPPLTSLTLGGFQYNPSSIRLDDDPLQEGSWSYSATEKILTISGIKADLTRSGEITWTQ